MRNNKKEVLRRIVFYTLLLCLPLNLGYHFILKTSYLHGTLIDYLVPVIYVQDILAVIFVLLNFSTIKNVVFKADKFLIWFLFAVLLSSGNCCSRPRRTCCDAPLLPPLRAEYRQRNKCGSHRQTTHKYRPHPRLY